MPQAVVGSVADATRDAEGAKSRNNARKKLRKPDLKIVTSQPNKKAPDKTTAPLFFCLMAYEKIEDYLIIGVLMLFWGARF